MPQSGFGGGAPGSAAPRGAPRYDWPIARVGLPGRISGCRSCRSALSRSVSFPMPLGQMPAIILVYPAMRHPVLTRMRVLPVAAHPFVASADPIPVAPEPDISGLRRRAVFLHSYRGRLDRYHRTHVVVTWRGRDGNDTSAQRHRQYGNCYQIYCAKTGLSHMHSNGLAAHGGPRLVNPGLTQPGSRTVACRDFPVQRKTRTSVHKLKVKRP
jgi:hypothetical protein